MDRLEDLKRRLREGEYVDRQEAADAIELLQAGLLPLDVSRVVMVRQTTEQSVCVVLDSTEAAGRFLRQLSELAAQA
ncbi:MAG: hypothetical protein ACXWVD_00390 [Telluria sp.]